MKNPKVLLTFIIAIVAYTVTALGYLESKFVSKEVFVMVYSRMERLENKIDKLLLERGIK